MNKNVLVLVTLGVISCVIVLGFVFKDRLFCPYDDSNVCQFVHTMPDAYAGEFITPQGVHIKWRWNHEDKEVIHTIQGDETFHIIYRDDSVYVKHISEDRWWKQTREESDSYGTQLVFDPAEYFSSLTNAFQSSSTKIILLGSETTAQGSCRMYRVETPEKYEICLDRGRLVMIRLANSIQNVVHDSEVTIETPQYGITDAPRGKNIILEAMEGAVTSSTPSYVKEFEQSRIEAEQQGSSKGPAYVTPASVATQ